MFPSQCASPPVDALILTCPGRIPFYGYIRLFFLLYLILPQTQGARVIYQQHIHPYLQENEAAIDNFIATSHDRVKAAGLVYIRQAIDYIRTTLLGQAPREHPPTPPPEPQGYTQSLLARFSMPAAAPGASDVYNLLAGAVGAATTYRSSSTAANVIPPELQSSGAKMDFITTQRERLTSLLTALDGEAQKIQQQQQLSPEGAEDNEPTQRPPSGLSAWSGISKSKSEADFENIEADSGTEEEMTARRRRGDETAQGGWMTWNWSATSSGVDKK